MSHEAAEFAAFENTTRQILAGMPTSSLLIRPLRAADRSAWGVLWDGYNHFYKATVSAEVTAETWRRFLDPQVAMHVLGAERNGELVAFATYLFHPSSWSLGSYCYLEDLFTAEAARGTGAGRALIAAVADAAKTAGAERLYWVTHQSNTVAQALYDKIAVNTGFIQYRKDI